MRPIAPVASPCISVCEIDDTTGLCKGCWRTRDEIALWPTASDAERLLILDRLRTRQADAGVHRRRRRPGGRRGPRAGSGGSGR